MTIPSDPWAARLLRRLCRAIPAILLAIGGTYVLNRAGILHELERRVLDAELTARPAQSDKIALVLISDANYNRIFQGRSPLAPDKLHQLIAAIARSEPRVIGVDIDTSHPDFRDFTVEPDWPPVIWERDVDTTEELREGDIKPLDVLGGRDVALNRSSGVPVLFDDPDDKVTRLYSRCVTTKIGPVRSFASAVALAYQANHDTDRMGGPACTQSTSDQALRFIRFSLVSADLDVRTAGQVLGWSGNRADGGQEQTFPDLRRKIVLVGGAYRDLDRHFTPLGMLPGVMALANAIQTELEGGGPEAPPRYLTFVVELVAGSILVLLMSVIALPPVRAFCLGVALTFAISLVCSLLTVGSLSGLAEFLPTLFAVLLFETYEHLRHASILRAVGARDEA
jgi:CHASE2 domain-containing sensor protein